MATLLMYVHDRTHFDGAVAGAGTALRPGHGLCVAVSVNHKVAGKLLFGVRIGAVDDFGLAIAYPNAGCRRSRLEPHAGTAAGLRKSIIEGGVIGPELLLVRLAERRIIVMDQHHVVHFVTYVFLRRSAPTRQCRDRRADFDIFPLTRRKNATTCSKSRRLHDIEGRVAPRRCVRMQANPQPRLRSRVRPSPIGNSDRSTRSSRCTCSLKARSATVLASLIF